MTVYQKYLTDLAILRSKHTLEEEKLKNQLKHEQALCTHKFIFAPNIFYVLGETCDGEKCQKCGKQRQLKLKENKYF